MSAQKAGKTRQIQAELDVAERLGFRVFKGSVARTPIQIKDKSGKVSPADERHLAMWDALISAETEHPDNNNFGL